jgi:hypothetical protein
MDVMSAQPCSRCQRNLNNSGFLGDALLIVRRNFLASFKLFELFIQLSLYIALM